MNILTKTKRVFAIALICVVAAAMMPMTTYAANRTKSKDGNWTYNADYNKNTCVITDWHGDSSTLAIPSKVDGLKVVEVNFTYQVGGWHANRIANREKITSISIPSTVKKLGVGCFANLPNLKKAVIPDTVKEIEGSLFYLCTGLTTATLPSWLTEVPESTFQDCKSLTSYTITSKMTRIGLCAFSGCESLKSIKIPSSVKELGDSCFAFSGLTSITIPNSVKTIESAAFYGCENLSKVKLPTGLTEISSKLFTNCKSLKSLVIPLNVKNIGFEVFDGCDNLTTLSIKGNPKFPGAYLALTASEKLTVYAPTSSKNVSKYCSDQGIRFKSLNAPTWSSKKRTTTTATMKWKKVSGATGYKVYKKTGTGSYKLVKTVSASTLSYKATGLKKGTTYRFYVTTLKKDVLGETIESRSSAIYKTYLKK